MTCSKVKSYVNPSPSDPSRRPLRTYTYGGPAWEKRLRSSARIRISTNNGITVLVTGAAGFFGTHVSAALKRRGDGVIGLDKFNDYYDPSLKRARPALLERSGIFIVEGDINDVELLPKLFKIISFTHIMHLAAQGRTLALMFTARSICRDLQICESTACYSLGFRSWRKIEQINRRVYTPRLKKPAKRYRADLRIICNRIEVFHGVGTLGKTRHGLLFFTKDILKGQSISIFESANHRTVARDFTYIDDIVKGCLASLDTAEKSTGNGWKKRGPAQLRVFNLGTRRRCS